MKHFINHSEIEECCICREIATKEFPYKFYNISNRIIYESNEFIVMPSLSPLATGHILIFSKAHIPNMMCLSSLELNKLILIIISLRKQISIREEDVLLFEHGAKDITSEACGINHAHLHLVPLEERVKKSVINNVIREYDPKFTSSFLNIYSQKYIGRSYLLFCDHLFHSTICFAENIPSQYMRKIIADELGTVSWDWKSISGYTRFRKTYDSLKYCTV